jgi:hypothetical protein
VTRSGVFIRFSCHFIVGALLFSFIAAEIAKPMDYRRPNDRFAILLPFSIAMGRVGCWFAGLLSWIAAEQLASGAQQAIAPASSHLASTFHLSIGATLVFLFRQGRFA